MKKCIIFGAGGTGRRIFKMIQSEYEIVCFVDNDETKWGSEVCGKIVNAPSCLTNLKFDILFIGSLMGINEQIDLAGIDKTKVNCEYVLISIKSREIFLENFKKLALQKNIEGEVAEAGVYQGEFAKVINRVFWNRKCYLFDTFEGFCKNDFRFEEKESLIEAEHLKKTSVQLVLDKMTTPQNCIIKKGYFPDTAMGLEESFMFVNLDMDLYKPIFEGITYFYPRMVTGGIILIHDYFSEAYPNVALAVADFEKNNGVTFKMMPIGDDISLAIIK